MSRAFCCPAHDDRTASMTVWYRGSEPHVHCHVGCSLSAILAASGCASKVALVEQLGVKDSPLATRLKPPPPRPSDDKEGGTSYGLELAQYAETKKLPLDFLRGLGIEDSSWMIDGAMVAAVKIPYYIGDKQAACRRYRVALSGDRFRWEKGSRPPPYGIWRYPSTVGSSYCIVAEGESDAQTLWLNDFEALGLPGSTHWEGMWEAVAAANVVYVIIEPDDGGRQMQDILQARYDEAPGSMVNFRSIRMPKDCKDPSSLWLSDQKNFKKRWRRLMAAAEPTFVF